MFAAVWREGCCAEPSSLIVLRTDHDKVCKLLSTYDKAFIVGADNVGSMQFQQIRRVSFFFGQWERSARAAKTGGLRREMPRSLCVAPATTVCTLLELHREGRRLSAQIGGTL